MSGRLAAAITKAASKQTYYTIRFLVDRGRVEDAYRAYAYFRWVDDILDADPPERSSRGSFDMTARVRFLDRQRTLLDRCLRGEVPRGLSAHEAMLVDLLAGADGLDRGLEAYVRHMMLVMRFDLRRRGRLISEAELTDYTRSLAIAVTEAMHHFIGGGRGAPQEDARYMAAAGAHIVHMLRDTHADIRAGYFNIPGEVLRAHSIRPQDVESAPYRAWVERRIKLARAYFDAGREYLARIPCRRHRLAALAYVGRFMWLTDTIEREGFVLRREYAERQAVATHLRIARDVASWMSGSRLPPGRSRDDAPSSAAHA